MEYITGWDIALFVAGGYLAVMALVRLMIRRRDQLLAELREQIKAERKRKKAQEANQTPVEEAEPRRRAA